MKKTKNVKWSKSPRELALEAEIRFQAAREIFKKIDSKMNTLIAYFCDCEDYYNWYQSLKKEYEIEE